MSNTRKPASTPPSEDAQDTIGSGGELHQTAGGQTPVLTTNHGAPIADDQNSLKLGARGPSLLEDFVLREKITHFDHERIPERIVHARGSAAHGVFRPYRSWAKLTRAAFLADPAVETPVFVRFSTVAGGAGSADMVRDVRGFAVKFYTTEGNFDLVGNNIPVFFIQDAIKFPDLIHAVKMEPDRAFPQAASAHDTFWDFASLMPESMHMLTWAMSDRAIPRSYRMMEGFGIHTFRFVDAQGASTFVKFHFRPKLGSQSVLWDEAVKINGADPDFHRRDLWDAIERGDFPEYELSVQAFDQQTADTLPFDVLDATKLIPEELVPLTPLGVLVLNRNPDNFFAETEQAAFHPGHLVPGIDVSDDPLLQGRLFSYLDTQLSRLGGPNFEQLPNNRPRCPMHNFQRDGHMQMAVPKGRVAYEPNSLAKDGPRECPVRGYASVPARVAGEKVRARAETFADHYSQARQFYRSLSDAEQRHVASAFAFELGKVETVAIRTRMLGHLNVIDAELGVAVARQLGMEGRADVIRPAREPMDLPPSPALSILRKAEPTLKGRKVGVLVSDGVELALVSATRSALEAEGARVELIAPRVGGVSTVEGTQLVADHALRAAPSVLFDSVVLCVSSQGASELAKLAPAIDFVRDAYGHLKVIGTTRGAERLLDKAAVEPDEGLVILEGEQGVAAYVAAARRQRIWDREPRTQGA